MNLLSSLEKYNDEHCLLERLVGKVAEGFFGIADCYRILVQLLSMEAAKCMVPHHCSN